MLYNILFLILSLFGVFLFIRGKIISSSVVLFFFITNGYQILPLTSMPETLSFSDFGLVQCILIFLYNLVVKKNISFRKEEKTSIGLLLFGLVMFFIVLYNYIGLGVSLLDSILTIRSFVFFLPFFFFSEISESHSAKLKKILLIITVVQSVLFVCQVFFNVQILNGYFGGGMMDLGFISLPRCYNAPLLLPYFLFHVFYGYLKEKSYKLWLRTLFLFTIALPMHRFGSGIVLLTLFLGCILSIKSHRKKVFVFVVSSFIFLVFIAINLEEIRRSTSFEDFQAIANSSYMAFDEVEDVEKTFFYRVALLSERVVYLLEDPLKTLFGGGLMREGTDQIKNLNFMILFTDYATGEDYVISTPDIAWSMIVFRLGLIGSIAYLFICFSNLRYFSSVRKNEPLAMGTYLFLIYLIGTSFTSSSFFHIWPFILPFIDYNVLRNKVVKDELSRVDM